MITIASLVFSMTLVALTLISQQLGPRILLLFMDDRETQTVLGLFIATFIFALIVLVRVGNETLGNKVPSLAVFLTAGLALLSLGMMIRFIHHISTRIQADVMIAELGTELNRAASHFVATEESDEHEEATAAERKRLEALDSDSAATVPSPRSGYLRRLDGSAICELAASNDLVLKVLARPGEFVLTDAPVLKAAPANGKGKIDDDCVAEISGLLDVGNRRTPEATIEFEINALVEVALRALSPAINDPFTAVACVDRLADGMRILIGRNDEQRISRDGKGEIRLVHAPAPFAGYLEQGFDAIRAAAKSHPMVLDEMSRLLSAMAALATGARKKAVCSYLSKVQKT
jgi:uncharacterized membrane protein